MANIPIFKANLNIIFRDGGVEFKLAANILPIMYNKTESNLF